jgi:hypothetical protein
MSNDSDIERKETAMEYEKMSLQEQIDQQEQAMKADQQKGFLAVVRYRRRIIVDLKRQLEQERNKK